MKKLIYALYSVMLLFLIVKCASVPQTIKIEDKKIIVPGQIYQETNIQMDDLEAVDSFEVVFRDTTTLYWEGEIKSESGKPAKAKAKFHRETKKLDLEVLIPEDTVSAPDTNIYIQTKPEVKSEFKFWGYWVLGFLTLIGIVLFIWKAR